MRTRTTATLAALLCLLPATTALAQVRTETEPNDTRAQAQGIRLGDSVEGAFQKVGDSDWFKLVVDKPGRNEIEILLAPTPTLQGDFVIQDKDGRLIWDAKEAGKGGTESVSHFVVTEGVYFIRISGRGDTPTDKYTLSSRPTGPWKENTEAEPNDEVRLASELRLDVPMTGRINKHLDNDLYVLTIPAPGRELLLVRLSGIPDGVSDLFLLDAKGKQIGETVRGDPGSGSEVVRMKAGPGTYYVRVVPLHRDKKGSEYTLYAGKPPKPPATPEEVQRALTKALGWLAKKQGKNGAWTGSRPLGYTGLSLMAFIGGKCAGQDYTSNMKRAVEHLKSLQKPSAKFPSGSKEAAMQGGLIGPGDMYEHAIGTLALTEALIDMNDTSLEPVVQDAINLILRTQNTERKPETLKGPVKPGDRHYGGWRYKPDSVDSDISITGWQVLALKAAVNAGFAIPDHVLPTAAAYVRTLQGKQDGSFEYESPGAAGNSAGRAGMGAFILQLSGFPQDPAVPPAIRFMQDHAPAWHGEAPGNGYPFYYWYYGTRAMYVAGGEDWRIWKDWMCRFLVDHQNEDGSWDGASQERNLDVYRVALGAMMLEFCCGQVPVYLSPVKRSVPGTIAVGFEKVAANEPGKAVEIIMDASNSMTGVVGKETKIAAARRVLIQTINGVPATMRVGLRVYGHRFGLDDYDNACGDTQLLAPIAPLNKAALVGLVEKVQTKGRTPLVRSVLEAIKDFEKIPNGSIILLTDGIESCKGDIKSIAPAIKAAGLDLDVNIVGFDITEAGGRQELESIARSTGGRYLDARNADELLSALAKALTVDYVVLDAVGKEVGRGAVGGGGGVRLGAGTYTVRVMVSPKPIEIKATLASGTSVAFTLKKVKGQWVLE
jgi:hypothetical protein